MALFQQVQFVLQRNYSSGLLYHPLQCIYKRGTEDDWLSLINCLVSSTSHVAQCHYCIVLPPVSCCFNILIYAVVLFLEYL